MHISRSPLATNEKKEHIKNNDDDAEYISRLSPEKKNYNNNNDIHIFLRDAFSMHLQNIIVYYVSVNILCMKNVRTMMQFFLRCLVF